jgi:hypothetical protein
LAVADTAATRLQGQADQAEDTGQRCHTDALHVFSPVVMQSRMGIDDEL